MKNIETLKNNVKSVLKDHPLLMDEFLQATSVEALDMYFTQGNEMDDYTTVSVIAEQILKTAGLPINL